MSSIIIGVIGHLDYGHFVVRALDGLEIGAGLSAKIGRSAEKTNPFPGTWAYLPEIIALCVRRGTHYFY
jgi:hypothetical protein